MPQANLRPRRGTTSRPRWIEPLEERTLLSVGLDGAFPGPAPLPASPGGFTSHFSDNFVVVSPTLDYGQGGSLVSQRTVSIANIPAREELQLPRAEGVTTASDATALAAPPGIGSEHSSGWSASAESTPVSLYSDTTPHGLASSGSSFAIRDLGGPSSEETEGNPVGLSGASGSTSTGVVVVFNVPAAVFASRAAAVPDLTAESLSPTESSTGEGLTTAGPAFSQGTPDFTAGHLPLGGFLTSSLGVGMAGRGGGMGGGWANRPDGPSDSIAFIQVFYDPHGMGGPSGPPTAPLPAPSDESTGGDDSLGGGSASTTNLAANSSTGAVYAMYAASSSARSASATLSHDVSSTSLNSGNSASTSSTGLAAISRETSSISNLALNMPVAVRSGDGLATAWSLSSSDSEETPIASVPEGTSALALSYRAASRSARNILRFEARQNPSEARFDPERSARTSENPETSLAEDAERFDSSGRAADLYAKFSPFDREALDRAIDEFLGDIHTLDTELTGVETTIPVMPGVVAVVFAVSAVETIRRRFKKPWYDLPTDADSDGDSSYPGLPQRRGPHLWGLENR